MVNDGADSLSDIEVASSPSPPVAPPKKCKAANANPSPKTSELLHCVYALAQVYCLHRELTCLPDSVPGATQKKKGGAIKGSATS